MKVEADIITSITANQKGQDMIMFLTLHRVSHLPLTISQKKNCNGKTREVFNSVRLNYVDAREILSFPSERKTDISLCVVAIGNIIELPTEKNKFLFETFYYLQGKVFNRKAATMNYYVIQFLVIYFPYSECKNNYAIINHS